jgi:3-oxoacyl-[acyl-carrier-protein] synthase-3
LLCHENGAPPLDFSLGTDGSGFEAICVPAGRARRPLSFDPADDAELYADILDEGGNPWRMTQPFMDGNKIFEFSITTVPGHLRLFMAHLGVTPDDVDALVLHQANRQIVDTVAAKAGFPPAKACSETFSNYGNLACASIPATLCDMFGGKGEARGRLLMCGFGVGLSWASCLLQSEGMSLAPVADFSPSQPLPGRDEYMRHWRSIFTGKEGSDE